MRAYVALLNAVFIGENGKCWRGYYAGWGEYRWYPSYLPKYKRLEQECIMLQRRHFPDMTLAQSDLHLWATWSGRL